MLPLPARSPPLPRLAPPTLIRDPKSAQPPPGPRSQLFWYRDIAVKVLFLLNSILFYGCKGLIFERPDALPMEALRNYTDVMRNFSKRDTITL